MSLDLSRDSFRPDRDYARVVQQQGRVQLDSDLNEQGVIFDRRMRTMTIDLALAAFHPAAMPDSFRITRVGGELMIDPGRYWVDGLLAENRGAGAQAWDAELEQMLGSGPIPYSEQPYLPDPPPPNPDRVHLAYLDLWRRPITYVEDSSLVEKAVGVDSAARELGVWQVRLLPIDRDNASCGEVEEDPAWQALLRPSSARLTNGTSSNLPDPNPCKPPASTGYLGQENQLYRVEIHDGGSPANATFKWSRENASVMTAVRQINGARTRLTVDSLGRDDQLSFHDGDWIEVTDELRVLNSLPGELARIALAGGIDSGSRTITLAAALPAGAFPTDGSGATDPARRTLVRRWDQSGPVLLGDGSPFRNLDSAGATGVIALPPAGTAVGLENGITVAFDLDGAGGEFRSGDYWIFEARAADAWIAPLTDAPPHGIHHHYAKLAVIAPDGDIDDCRTAWPTAGGDCACTIVVPAGFDLAGLPALLPPNRQVHICLCAGEFVVDAPVVLDGRAADRLNRNARGNLKLSGAGGATRVATRDEAAFILQRWESVAVHDFTVMSGVNYTRRKEGVGILGGLTVRETAEVQVHSLRSDCSGGVGGQKAACIRVFGGPNEGEEPDLRSVRIRDCTLLTGPDATGILVTDARQSDISGNEVRPSNRPPDTPTIRGRRRTPTQKQSGLPGASGILVAGSFAREVRIHDNSIAGTRSGIRVALSHDAPRDQHDVADRVVVTGNRIDLSLRARGEVGPEGIFLGNTDSLIVRDNAIALTADSLKVAVIPHGIQIGGAIGRMAIVRSNHMVRCRKGISLHPLGIPDDPLWVIADNLAEGADEVVDAPSVAREENNLA